MAVLFFSIGRIPFFAPILDSADPLIARQLNIILTVVPINVRPQSSPF